ncbi:HDOD domain-containing protein [Litorivicinus lipolyticus]|uniref:HDOD domain-containing protein n=1 Tax=Litorivicinus lipolyticus TaxID=418701 RepID=A0A5Q2Q962_9GAMM|nr:HDOD domain-containing protein [Litorivicinus lipolyticus]QGG79693.1 HDOD domain-containing protein [Litorivicinus lipolyticus]
MRPNLDTATLVAHFWNDFSLGHVRLPVLPDLAFKLHDLMSEANYEPALVSQALAQDAGVSARLVAAANNVLNRGRVPVATLDMAIMRLGRERTQALANAHLLKQLFHGSPAGKKRLQLHWDLTQRKAVTATYLADLTDSVEPSEPLLLTLLQNLGALPLIDWMERHPDAPHGLNALVELDQAIGTQVAQKLLSHWHYNLDWIDAIGRRESWHYLSDGPLNSIDVSLLASWSELESSAQPGPPLGEVAAFKKWSQACLPATAGIGDLYSEDGQTRLAALAGLLD